VNMSQPPQTISIKKWKDTPTRNVDVAGTTLVYRQLGPAAGVPVILLNHWGAVPGREVALDVEIVVNGGVNG
jgi:hypothetical protein